ncbi:MAG TPA: hypothetical protein VIX82_19475, partial [Solirubrobacteraceae bacterium]
FFSRSGTTWTPQGRARRTGEEHPDNFGYSVALSFNGDTALIGDEDVRIVVELRRRSPLDGQTVTSSFTSRRSGAVCVA